MTIAIFIAVALGIGAGILVVPPTIIPHMGNLITFGLCLLLFFVGIDVGRQGDLFKKIREMGFRILLVPFMVALGSVLGTMAGGLLLHIPWYQAGAVGAGFGWYSFSAIELSKHSAQLGTLAFITNISREVMALISIPFVARYIGKLESIAPAGATSMDVTLPIISRSTDGNVAIIAFITGVVLTAIVPVLVPFLMTFG
ncbi:lysine exporter LysO family protein [Anoxynatronum sibiricum]|uniref:Lysine exporter LysO family protein n=1 Tax=Anoxynatronum sibiricum TaxID=210623 RepID=A0ABU9VQ21_9CLOT